jgi:hypothetical protein
MAKFIGTRKEFKRYFGPRLRNLVNILTRNHKKLVGACEHCCHTENELESAHIHGRGRTQLIDQILAAPTSDSILEIDLDHFEELFRAEHSPPEKSILILCHECHRSYDSMTIESSIDNHSISVERIETTRTNDLLPITLSPSTEKEFKAQLLIQRKATISIYYLDGTISHRTWNASKFTEKSNLSGNIRSRPEFRNQAWQGNGIIKVHVAIESSASTQD